YVGPALVKSRRKKNVQRDVRALTRLVGRPAILDPVSLRSDDLRVRLLACKVAVQLPHEKFGIVDLTRRLRIEIFNLRIELEPANLARNVLRVDPLFDFALVVRVFEEVEIPVARKLAARGVQRLHA